MTPKRIVYFLMIVTLLVPLTVIYGQDGGSDFPDADSDGIPDEFDGCPSQAGSYENDGCPDGIAPPDSDGDSVPDVRDNCPDVVGNDYNLGCPDSDGDGIDDFYDQCVNEAGLSQNSGCPLGVQTDWDRDGLLDNEDYCAYEAGSPANFGCPDDYVDDYDGDNVPDFRDSCFDRAGDPANNGCPPGVEPDLDSDTVPDGVDQCPLQFGDPANNGCIIDTDGDLLRDVDDACPDQPGDGRNNGCPEGSAAPDGDEDGVIDLYDRCPTEPGSNSDCPDSDGDTIADLDDACPDQAGDPAFRGCMQISDLTLPANRVVLSTSNIVDATQFGQLVTDVNEVAVATDGTLVVQGYGTFPMAIYDLNNPALSPVGGLETMGGNIALSSGGTVLLDTQYLWETDVSAVVVWDVASQNSLQYLETPQHSYTILTAVRSDGVLFATADAFELYGGPPADTYSIRLWDITSGQEVGVVPLTEAVTQMVFSPDGAFLAVGTNAGTIIWNVATLSPAVELPVAPMFAGNSLTYSPDGSRLAIGDWSGSITMYDAASGAEIYNALVLQSTRWDAVLALAFSPDGSLLTAGGGPFVDGPAPEGLNNQVAVLDAATGVTLTSFDNLPSPPFSATFSPDGTLLIFSSSPTVQFWGIAQ